tara:strand:- start:440 stop:970 length:531 start_codon:yes stop_codon:yes gene_type:complete
MNIKRYDWNSLITMRDRDLICDDVRQAVSEGKFWTNSPKYQTNFNVFGIQSPSWMKLKMSFIMSCFMFLDKEVQIKNIQAWSFMTQLPGEDRDKLWHHHWHDKTVNSVSGVYYVHLPEAHDECGTEFAPQGPEAEERYMEPPFVGGWIIYESKEWHRPGILKSKEPRFIVAADMMY